MSFNQQEAQILSVSIQQTEFARGGVKLFDIKQTFGTAQRHKTVKKTGRGSNEGDKKVTTTDGQGDNENQRLLEANQMISDCS